MLLNNQGKDSTLEPAYFARTLMASGNSNGDFSTLQTQISRLSATVTSLNFSLSTLVNEQAVQNENIAYALDEIEEIKENLKKEGVTEEDVEQIINSYLESIIGKAIPVAARQDESALLAWLKEQDELGITLDQLSKRIDETKAEPIETNRINALFNP